MLDYLQRKLDISSLLVVCPLLKLIGLLVGGRSFFPVVLAMIGQSCLMSCVCWQDFTSLITSPNYFLRFGLLGDFVSGEFEDLLGLMYAVDCVPG